MTDLQRVPHAASPTPGDPVVWPAPGTRPQPVSLDPFAEPPPGWASAAPGTVLHRRSVRIGLFGRRSLPYRAWQLLYRSTDHRGRPVTTVTTVIVPGQAAPDAPLLAYQCAIDAFGPRNFPSYALLQGARGPFTNPMLELLLIGAALARGWVVSVCDHEGPQGLYTVPRQPGYHVLDGIRATLSLGPLPDGPTLSERTPVGLCGYSGGGLASSWTAELAPSYAPELNIVGAALGAPVPDIHATLLKFNGSAFAGMIAPGLNAIAAAYPEIEALVQKHVTVKGREILRSGRDLTPSQAIRKFRRLDLDTITDAPLMDLIQEPALVNFFADAALGQHAPTCPVYVYSSVHDQLVPIEGVDRQVGSYTAGGTPVTFRRERFAEHLSLVLLGAPGALSWLADRFAGAPLPAGSGIQTVRGLPVGFKSALAFLRDVVKFVAGRV